jgi:magnesium-transporting ATPase (P-type)
MEWKDLLLCLYHNCSISPSKNEIMIFCLNSGLCTHKTVSFLLELPHLQSILFRVFFFFFRNEGLTKYLSGLTLKYNSPDLSLQRARVKVSSHQHRAQNPVFVLFSYLTISIEWAPPIKSTTVFYYNKQFNCSVIITTFLQLLFSFFQLFFSFLNLLMYYINLNTKYVNIALKEDKTKGNLYPDL